MYRNGKGVARDEAEAVRWCRKAADPGYVIAQYALGISCFYGQGVPQDFAEAARWYRKAAEQGYAVAQYELGFMYHHGQGVPQDDAEAVRWYRKSADQGDENAQIILAVMYYRGQEVSRNDVETARWFAIGFGKAAASCFRRTNSGYGRWTFILSILLLLPVLFVGQRRWGRFTWVSLALCSAGLGAGLAHELLFSKFSPALLNRHLPGAEFSGFGRALWLAFLAVCSASYAVGAVAEARRVSKRGRSLGQPPIN
jgi:Sel1 repeat